MKKGMFILISLTIIIFLSLSVFGFLYIMENLQPIYWIAYACLVSAIGIIIIISIFSHRRMASRMQQMQTKFRENKLLERRLVNSEDIALNYLPIGMLIYNDTLQISWANHAAKEIFSNVLIERNLTMVHQELAKTIEKREGRFILSIYGKDYEIIHYPKNHCLYLFEVTDRESAKRLLREQEHVIGVISLDNFNEATQNLDFQFKTTLQGKFLGALDAWCRKHRIYFVNLRPEKSVIYLTRKQLDVLIKEEFQILDTINDIANQNEVRVTLSMGIACHRLMLDRLGELAEEALKLALGRGGDQVVVNFENLPLKVFGGKSNTVEKRTKITARINSRALSDNIEKYSSVMIMPHRATDIDALGASIGLLEMALAQKKPAKIVLNFDDIDLTTQKVINMLNREYVKLMEYFVDSDTALDETTSTTLLIIVDHHSPVQSIAPKLIEKTKNIIVVDHHRRIDNLLSDVTLIYLEPYASSSVELVIELIELSSHEVDIDPFEATIMLAGMMIDTNNFTYRTGVRTFEAAALLKSYGADPFKARLILRESLDHMKSKSNLVNQAEIINNHFAITKSPKDVKTTRVQLAKTADELLEIDNIIASFAIGSLGNDQIAISARSVDSFNVSVLMEHFGGGGHLNNAAAQVENGDIETIAKKIEGMLENIYKEDTTMKVILVKDLRGKGKKGDLIDVASGYGNYLLTSKQAIEASSANIRALEEEKTKQEKQSEMEIQEALNQKEAIEAHSIKIYVKIGENGKLFGAVSSKQIADEYKKGYNIDIDKRKIELEDNIHSLGAYQIPVRLHKDVSATIDLQVLEEKA